MNHKLLRRLAPALLALLLALPAVALAATAQVPEFGLSVSFPASLDVFTRDMIPDDPLLALYGQDTARVREELAAAGLYARAFDIAGDFTLDLAVARQGGQAPADMDEAALSALAGQLGGGGYEPFDGASGRGLLVYTADGQGLVALLRARDVQLTLRLRATSPVNARMANLVRGIASGVDLGQGQ